MIQLQQSIARQDKTRQKDQKQRQKEEAENRQRKAQSGNSQFCFISFCARVYEVESTVLRGSTAWLGGNGQPNC